MPFTDGGRGQSGRLQDGRRDVDDVVELVAGLALVRQAVGPVHDRAVAGAAPVRGHLLGPLVRRAQRVRPADRVVVVGLRGAEVVDLGQQELGGLDARHAVERGHLVEAAVERALGRGAVVADDVVDQRVVEDAEVVDRVDDPADLVVGLLEEAGVDLHLSGQHRLEVVRHVVPAGISSCRLVSSASFGTTPSFFCWLERLLPQRIPAVVELALVLVRPLLGHVVRGVGGAGREVHEERLVGHQRLLLAHPGDGAVGQILGERVALLGRLRRLDRRGALVQARVVLVGLAADEAVEVLEPRTGGPLVERARPGRPPTPAPRGTCRTARSNSR